MKRDVIAGPPTGGFRLDGSWDENGRQDAPLTNLVRDLRRCRRLTTITPPEAAGKVPTTFLDAFPNLEQWQACYRWHECRCSTSVESAVVYCHDGHAEPFVPQERSCGAVEAIFSKALEFIRDGYTPMQVADFFAAHIDDPELSGSEQDLIREAMKEWAGKGAVKA